MKTLLNELKACKVKNFLMLVAAGAVNACGITLFLQPVLLYDSGISGTAMLLGQLTPLSLSLFLLILNVPLFLYGWKKQGTAFTVYAIFAVAMYSLFAFLITDVLPIDLSQSPLAESDVLLCALFGGLISGAGSGLAIRFGGAMDGIDVMGVIFAKRLGITIGTFVMLYNVLLYIVCGIVIRSWILPLYSIVTYAVASRAVDFIVDGLDRSKCAMIVTSEADEVCRQLGERFGTGTTRIAARGGYSGASKTMVYFIVNRFEVTKLREIVREIDPLAYITISDVADVFSAGTE